MLASAQVHPGVRSLAGTRVTSPIESGGRRQFVPSLRGSLGFLCSALITTASSPYISQLYDPCDAQR
jgi:hypothetical protein